MSVEGVVISRLVLSTDWDQVAHSGLQFGVVKASEGKFIKDRLYYDHIRGARNAGLLVSAYHFYRLEYPPLVQAETFLSQIKTTPLDLPIFLEFQEATLLGTPKVEEDVHTWLLRVESSLGRRPMILTSKYFWETFVGSPSWSSEYLLGVSDSESKKSPILPTGWDQWEFWESRLHGTVLGLLGTPNIIRFRGSEDDLFSRALKPSEPLFRGEILGSRVQSRSGPGITYEILGKYPSGGRLDVWSEETESYIDASTRERVSRVWGSINRTLSKWVCLSDEKTTYVTPLRVGPRYDERPSGDPQLIGTDGVTESDHNV